MNYYLLVGLQLALQSFLPPFLVEAFNQTTSIDSVQVPSYDVVIVGAGWCGMAAARTLEASGITNYKILEASDRIGGRTQTVYEEIDGEIVALDMGTQWMSGGADQNPLYEFAVAANVSFVVDKYKTNVYQSNNTGLIPGADDDGLDEVFDKYWYYYRNYRRKRRSNGRKDQPLAIVLRKFRATLTDFNERLMFNYIVKAWIGEIEYAAGSEDLSLYTFDEDWRLDDSNLTDSGFWLKDWSAVVNTYAEPIQNKIQTGAVVTQIKYRKASEFARVYYTNDDGETEKIRAKKVLVTVSLGVLQKKMITFKPPIKKKQKIINRIGMGTGNHMWMFFDEAFWPENDLKSIFGDGEDRDNFAAYYNNLAEHGLYNKPGLMVPHMGQDAQDAEQRFRDSGDEDAYKEEVKELCMGPLRNMFGEDIPDPKYVFVSSWMTNPYTHGIFSFNKVKQKRNDKQNLRVPINNRLYFRGEHTSDAHYGWVHGAYWEGVAVAEEMAGELLE